VNKATKVLTVQRIVCFGIEFSGRAMVYTFIVITRSSRSNKLTTFLLASRSISNLKRELSNSVPQQQGGTEDVESRQFWTPERSARVIGVDWSAGNFGVLPYHLLNAVAEINFGGRECGSGGQRSFEHRRQVLKVSKVLEAEGKTLRYCAAGGREAGGPMCWNALAKSKC